MPHLSFAISDLHQAYASGTSPAAMVETMLARIAAADDPGIFIHLQTETELAATIAGLGAFDPATKPLWGIPFAVKDNIDVGGVPTTAACREFAYVPEHDAVVVARLKAAGAIFVGKTNLDQFATGLVGTRTPFPVPRNVIDPALVPGGSSSGSAVATARGIVSFALGTDTAGSGRVPAALNGIVGLKPSLGAVSTRGVVPACRTLDCVSVFALSVEDAWTVFASAAAFDADDPYARARDVISSGELPASPVVGVPSASTLRFFGDELQAAAFARAVDHIRVCGASVVDLDFTPLYGVADMLYEGAWVAERLAAVSEFMASHAAALHPVTRKIIEGAKDLTAVDAFQGFYRLQGLKRGVERLLAGIEFLCVPSVPTLYKLQEVEADPFGPNARLGTYTNFVNLLDMCGTAMPMGSRSDGRPASITLLARGGQDRRVADFAQHIASTDQRSDPAPLPSPQVARDGTADAASSEHIELIVVGAHLRGMPLNHELLAHGARFLRSARTVPEYNLFALPQKQSPKPGLLRVGPVRGTPIEVEVWSLSPHGFASFVSAIPEPLGIGRIALADGSSAQGFLVESIAVEKAANITQFGGWRRYIASLGHGGQLAGGALA